MKKLLTLAIVLASAGWAQRLDPVQWSLAPMAAKIATGQTAVLRLEAKLDEGWHLYSPTTPEGGPIPTTIALQDSPAVSAFRVLEPKPERKFDPNFNLDTETFEKSAVFYILADLKKDAATGPLQLTALMRYQACNDRLCLPPRRKTATAKLAVEAGAPAVNFGTPEGYTEVKPGASHPATAPSTAPPTAPAAAAQGMGQFLLIAFGLGLAAIFTPCVFPMIPITVSFFLGQQTGVRRQAVAQAVVFCLGIIVLFCLLGLGVTAALGPFGVVQLGSNPWVNGFITAVFLAFGLSLLGAFEITIPSSVLTKLDSASRRGGYLGTLLMGLTFSLTSVACVGPFVGTLLAASVQGQSLQPVLGMLFFAVGLALPFFLLALFPAYLQRLPKSGVWMMRVKVVLGFVILAAMLKYLSNVDQVLQLNWITRERFLAAWVVLFALPGLYLLGFLRMEGVKPEEKLGVARALSGAVFLIFAISLVPGMFGARLGELEAYVPPASQGRLLGGAGATEDLVWMKDQYREALAKARAENKLVLVTFTGYACTNCHWMKANMFTRPEIYAAAKKLVLVELYTDGTDEVSRSNQELEEKRFGTVAIPFYAILDPDERVIASFPGLTKNPQEFLAFLQSRAKVSGATGS